MTTRFEHPLGLAPPAHWESLPSIPAAEFREWLAMTKAPPARHGKFNAKVGYRADLGFSVRSALEANTARLLLFLGYQRWTEKEPPTDGGRWFRYEGQEFILLGRGGKTVTYKPDFHLWDGGAYSLWECKGVMDQRSKQRIRLWEQQHPEIPLTVITREELDARKAQSLYEARRRGEMVLDIPGWE